MSKGFIIEQKRNTANWAQSLKQMPEALWFKPFKAGSWGTGEVIAHFIFWDQFVIDNRLKPFLQNGELPEVEVDVQKINDAAAEYARSRDKDLLIDEFISTREDLTGYIRRMPDTTFVQLMPGKPLSWNKFFEGLIEHDRKHQLEIDAHFTALLKDENK
ncbi:DinB family protein [Bacillus sp. SCS-153A]|uniref:DinB family protein n=1 Tax=Rossellomorea sedimentorum TaxID=3115294 RepID=UPI003906AA39